MAVERCNGCGRLVDLDWHVEGITYVNGVPLCEGCGSDYDPCEDESDEEFAERCKRDKIEK